MRRAHGATRTVTDLGASDSTTCPASSATSATNAMLVDSVMALTRTVTYKMLRSQIRPSRVKIEAVPSWVVG